MDLKSKKILIAGAGISGIGAAALLGKAGIPAAIYDGNEALDPVSYTHLIAFSPEVTGIDEEGFSYPLHQAALYNKESIGVSNEIVEKEATLRLQSGYLIVMRTTD